MDFAVWRTCCEFLDSLLSIAHGGNIEPPCALRMNWVDITTANNNLMYIIAMADGEECDRSDFVREGVFDDGRNALKVLADRPKISG